MRSRFLIPLLILLLFSASAESRETRNTLSSSWVSFRDELTSNYVVSLDIDRYGTLWIGTADGVNSFDGVGVNRYTKYSGALPGNEMNAVIADRFDDGIWFATKRNGLGYYSWATEESFFLDSRSTPSLPSNEITDIAQDRRGDIWFSTYTDGICRFDPKEQTVTRYYPGNTDGFPEGTVRCFCIGADGRVYIGFYGDGIAVLDPRSMTATSYRHDPDNSCSLPSNEVGYVYNDRENNVWVGTRRGLALFRPVTQDFTVFDSENSGLPGGIIFSILLTEDRKLLVSPDMCGLWAMDLNEGGHRNFVKITSPDLFDDVGIHAMAEDVYGNVWLGSAGKGLIFMSENRSGFSTLSYPEVLTERIVRGLSRNGDGELLVATDGGSLNILDSSASLAESFESAFTDRNAQSVFCDSDGQVWLGMYNQGVSVMDERHRPKFSIRANEVHTFREYGDTMWLASGVGGLYAADRKTGRILGTYRSPEYFPDNYLKSMCIDRQGRIWIGTFRSGLFVFDRHMNRLARFSASDGFPSNSINHIIQDSRGGIWAATGEGLVHFPESTESIAYDRVFDERDNLSSDIIMSVTEDSDGDIWFSTTNSIVHLKDSTVTSYSTKVAGMTQGNFSAGAAVMWNRDLLAFGTSDGVVFVNKSRTCEKVKDIPIHFARIKAHSNSDESSGYLNEYLLAGLEEIRLNHRQNNFSLSFAADNFALHNNLEYSYKIDGLGGEWFHSEGNELSFFRLPPKRYLLHVRARSIGGDWTGDMATLRIVITPPLYATLAAKILYLLILAGMVIWVSLVYIQKALDRATISSIKETNEEKLRFYTNITHELKTPITLILGPAEDIMNDTSLGAGSRKKAELVFRNAQNLLELINRLLNFRKAETGNVQYNPTYGDLSTFVHDIGTIFVESNTNRNIGFVFQIENGISLDFDREIITSILNNLLSNALKYTARGTITIGLRREGDYALISVADTGQGIAKDQLDKIFDRFYRVPGKGAVQGNGIGLAIVKHLAEIHRGAVTVDSKKGVGSIFTVSIPVGTSTAAWEDHDKEESGGDKLRIVVVEDNDDIRDYLRETLSGDYDVYCASDGESGIGLAMRQSPDLIISDIMMPRMDGLELCSRVKKDLRLSHIPVILLTAKDTMEDKSAGYKAGADSYITKPFTADIIRARISNLIESRRKLANTYLHSISGEGKPDAPAEKLFSPMDNGFMKKLTAYIEDNLSSENLDMENLASNMNLSISSLYRKVKSLIGITANEYIRKVKMKKAAEMLASGEFNVSETAWNVGISSMAYFRQCFKEEYGCTPSEYKKRAETSSPAHSTK